MSETILSSLTAYDVHSLHLVTMKGPLLWRRRNRERCAFAVKLSGRTEYTSNGLVIVSDPDHVVLLPQGSSYTVRLVSPGPCIMVEFDGRVLTRDIISFYLASKRLSPILSRMERLLKFKKGAYRLHCLALLYEMAGSLPGIPENGQARSSGEEMIAPSLAHIEKNFCEHGISNKSLAGLSGISTVYFRKIFQSVRHMSPMKYIKSLKIEKAKSLLMSEASVGDVAERCGFSDIYHFSRDFKKVTGVTPSGFRRMGM